MSTSTSVILAERPTEGIVPGTTFKHVTSAAPTADDLEEGQILAETLYLSLDPAMRGWISKARSYVPPVQIGETMRGSALLRVLASRSSTVAPGDLVTAFSGWREMAVLPQGQFEAAASAGLPEGAKPTDLLSVLGATGLTAYFGLLRIGEPKKGETVVVSGAAGATGSVVAQIAKHVVGSRVVAIAGGPDKCRWLVDELGCDVAIDYKAEGWQDRLREATPNYIDVYFDNVGGEILDLALERANKFSRFVMCGGISQYNSSNRQGPKNYTNIITQRIKMQGFIYFDFAKEHAAARQELAGWFREGKIKSQDSIVKGGIAQVEHALIDLFKGVNTGKMLLEVKAPEEASKL